MATDVTAVAIAAMTEDDVEAVLAIDLASLHGQAAGGEDPRVARERHLREELARGWARLRVARGAGSEIVGYVLFWHVTDEIHLLDVAVAPSARRQGIGRTLVGEVRGYGETHRAAKILLEVRAGNAGAIALYAGLGFERFNVRRGYYPDGEHGVEMVLTLEGTVSG